MFENLDDPRKQALLALAAGLFSPVRGKGFSGFGEALGQGVNAGLLGFNQAQRTQEAVKRGEMERQLEQARLAQMKQAQDAQAYMGQGIGKFMSPGAPGVPYNDSLGNGDQGFVQPPQSPSFDKTGFAQYLAQNPATAREALNFLPQPKDMAPLVLKPGEVAFDKDTGKPRFSAPEKAKFQAGDTREIKAGQFVITQEYDGKQWKQVGKAMLWKPDAEPKPVYDPAQGGYVTPPRNGVGPSFIPVPGVTPPQKNMPSEAELTAAGYASRMNAADAQLSQMGPEAIPGIRQTIANNKYPTLAPFVSSPEQQQFRQLQEDWVRAKLRKESGAVIADEEMAREIRVYFPQPGDSPQVIKQKAEARARANKAMMMASGKASGRVPQQDSQPDPLGIR